MAAAKPKTAAKSFDGLLAVGERVGGYDITKELGQGGFGAVYKVKDANGQEFAMKIESKKARLPVIRIEVVILAHLKASQNKHFCYCDSYGHTEHFSYIVMQLVGPSIHDLCRQRKNRQFSMSTALRVGLQCIEAVQHLHSIGYIHRDLKGANFAIGLSEKDLDSTVFTLDFGMCRHYKRDGKSVRQPRQLPPFRGTVRYMSVNCHLQREQSARDDMESWLYMHIEYTFGSLPWCSIGDRRDKTAIFKMRARDPSTDEYEQLFTNCPDEYREMMAYLATEAHYYTPFDYDKFIGYLATIHLRECKTKITDENPYDWQEKQSQAIAIN